MKKLLFSITFSLLLITVSGQTLTLTFTGRDANDEYLRTSRVVINNLTRGWQETLSWPDTILMLQSETGIEDISNQWQALRLGQNNPNPFEGTTFVNMTVPEPGNVKVEITDILGRTIHANDFSLQMGTHQLRVSLSTTGVYFLTVRMNGAIASVKMINRGNGGSDMLEYNGVAEISCHDIPSTKSYQLKNSPKNFTMQAFNVGDTMEYIGFAFINGGEEESVHIMRELIPSSDPLFIRDTVTLRFDTVQTDGLPCAGTPTLTDIDGNVYNTVKIGSQCWMAENLRTTRYADSSSILMDSNSTWNYTIPYRYAPGYNQNNEDNMVNVPIYGYLYNWPAVMHGADSGSFFVQGNCPDGWHVPSDAEWIQLIDYMATKSMYMSGGDETHLAKALAATWGWNSSSDTDAIGNNPEVNNATGFSALPAGYYHYGDYDYYGDYTLYWSSSTGSQEYNAYGFGLHYYNSAVYRNAHVDKSNGYSVRCVKDE